MSLKNYKHIELWGLPGVGKTTLTEKLVTEKGYFFIAARQMPLQKIRLMYRYPLVMFYWMPLIIRCYTTIRSLSLFRYNVALLFAALQRQYDAEMNPGRKSVIDESLLQRLLSYSDVLVSESEVEKLLSVSPVGEVVVCVNHREVESDRYSGGHLRNSLGEGYVKQWRQNMRINHETLRRVLERVKDVNYVETSSADIMTLLK